VFLGDAPLFLQLLLKDGDAGIRFRQETACLVFFVVGVHKGLGQCFSQELHGPSGIAGHALRGDCIVCKEMLDAMAARFNLAGRAGDADPRPLVERLHADAAFCCRHICQKKSVTVSIWGIHDIPLQKMYVSSFFQMKKLFYGHCGIHAQPLKKMRVYSVLQAKDIQILRYNGHTSLDWCKGHD